LTILAIFGDFLRKSPFFTKIYDFREKCPKIYDFRDFGEIWTISPKCSIAPRAHAAHSSIHAFACGAYDASASRAGLLDGVFVKMLAKARFLTKTLENRQNASLFDDFRAKPPKCS